MTPADLSRPILIHCCKDRTLTYRARNEPIFNGVALPVFSVETKAQAEALIIAAGKRQYEAHPLIPGRAWLRVFLPDEGLTPPAALELSDLDRVSDYLRAIYDAARCAAEPS